MVEVSNKIVELNHFCFKEIATCEKRKIKYENHSCYRKKVLVIMYKK